MLKSRRRPSVAVFAGLLLASAGAPALAQEGNTIGPPQLRDFQLKGERRTPPPPPQQVVPAPAPAAAPRAPAPAPAAARRPEPRERTSPAEERRPSAERPAPAPALPSQPENVFRLPQDPAGEAPLPAPAGAPPQTAPAAPAPPREQGPPLWLYLAGAGIAALGIALYRRRRRRADRAAAAEAEASAAPPPAPRPEPIPRPWLELELRAERAAQTDEEAWVEFEMILRNTGKSTARNIRMNARLFNAGREQDKEIGAFFKTKGEGRRTHVIPELPAGERGLVQGTVSMPREEMRALQVNDQLLFIPVVGVNLVYDWGEGRTGQTSKSYVIGRDLGAEKDKMGAFRVDLGPRVYRTVGQRQHSLAKRV